MKRYKHSVPWKTEAETWLHSYKTRPQRLQTSVWKHLLLEPSGEYGSAAIYSGLPASRQYDNTFLSFQATPLSQKP